MTDDLLKLWFWPWEAVRVSMQMAETLAASHSVIGARLPMIGLAMSDPFRANHRELTQMVTEKSQAFGRSQRKASTALETVRRSSHANARDMGRLSGGDLFGPADWLAMFERNIAAAVALSAMPAEMLAPIHRQATSNARRLKAKTNS